MPGSTTNFGFEYPLDTDALADGAQEIQNFAETADTTFVDLLGGTTGQYLTKNTNTNMDFVWATLPTIPAVPTASSTYYFSNLNNHSGNTLAASTGGATGGHLRFVPVLIAEDMTIDRIGLEVTTASAGATIRLGLYEDNAGAPGDLIADFGTVSGAAVGVVEATISQALTKGRVFAAWVPSNNSMNFRRVSNGWNLLQYTATQADAVDPSGVHWLQTGVTGALPATATASLTSSGTAFSNVIITMRRA